MSNTTVLLGHTVLAEAAGLRLIHLPEDDVAFIEIPADQALEIDALQGLLKIADGLGWTDPSGLIEDASLFGDGFDDRIVLVRK